MPRRGFGGCAGVAADTVQRLHRHIEFVAAQVLEHQEFGWGAIELHDLQAAIAPHAMVFVHHGRPFGQVFQFTKQCFRVALGALAAALRTRAFAEQLLFRNDC